MSAANGNPRGPNLISDLRNWINSHPIWSALVAYLTLYLMILQPAEVLRAVRDPEPDIARLAVFLAAGLPVLLSLTWAYALVTGGVFKAKRLRFGIVNVLGAVVTGTFVYSSLIAIHKRSPRPVNPQAVIQLQRARDYERRADISKDNLLAAERHYLRAIELDPTYALAHAYLGKLSSRIYFLGYDRTPMRLDRARTAIHQARNHAPDMPELQMAEGYFHYWGLADYARAEQYFNAALKHINRDPEIYAGLGYMQRRQGRWKEALSNLQRAAQYDASNPDRYTELAVTFDALYCYADAERAYRTALSLASDAHSTAISLGYMYLRSTGRIDSLAVTASSLPTRVDPDGDYLITRVNTAVLQRRFIQALRTLERSDQQVFERQGFIYTPAMLRGLVFTYSGKHERARLPLDSARASFQAMLQEERDDPRIHASLAFIHAGLREDASAVQHAKEAVSIIRRSRRSDALDLPTYQAVLAAVYTQIGRGSDALELLRHLVQTPSGPSVHEIRLDPVWDPLRPLSGYRSLMATRQRCALPSNQPHATATALEGSSSR